jgi:hypothetical protein
MYVSCTYLNVLNCTNVLYYYYYIYLFIYICMRVRFVLRTSTFNPFIFHLSSKE